LISRWPGDLVAKVANKYYEGYTLMAAHMEIPRNAVVGVLDAVRNKALQFALEIEQQAPTAGEVSPGTKPVPDERVAQIFNTYIMGGAQNVALGNRAAVQHAQQIQAGNADALKRFLRDQGVETADLAELETAIARDPAPKGERFGKRVSAWVGKMVSKAASGVWDVGTKAAVEVVTTALKAYYDLP